MSKFDINKKQLYEILSAKGIDTLFHANTISTSITFLNAKLLLSRKYVEENGLFQTVQYTDTKDKLFGIWDDVFLDAMDIHTVFNKANLYGPFLFCFDSNLILSEDVKTIRITRKNPSNWDPNETEDDWYYSDLNEFDQNYKKGNKTKDVGSMFILKDIDGKFPLKPHLKKVMLDNPSLAVDFKGQKTELASIITSELDQVLITNEFQNIEKELRHKHNFYSCKCWYSYNGFLLGNFNELKKLFHSKPNI
jgi:hypothetical protein